MNFLRIFLEFSNLRFIENLSKKLEENENKIHSKGKNILKTLLIYL